jgi:hypothetical protein
MAAPSHVFTISGVAAMLGKDEDLLRDLVDSTLQTRCESPLPSPYAADTSQKNTSRNKSLDNADLIGPPSVRNY